MTASAFTRERSVDAAATRNGAGHRRADIDGLRAIAVAAVLIYHGFPTLFPAGFLGVDIFFVISGFVITAGLRQAQDAGRWSLADFYARRVRRLFPALAIVLSATLVLCWFVLLPGEYRQTAKLATGAGLSLVNLQLLRESGYFDIATATKPLMHLWSLGVEEQFYLCWPLLFLVIARWRRPAVWVMAIAAASFALEAVWLASEPAHAFYNPLPRAWELLAGVSLAWLPPRWRSPRWLAGAGLVLIALALLSQAGAMPALALMSLVVAGTAGVIAAGSGQHPARWLGAQPLQWLGRISYPLYLWHWPVIALRNLLGSGEAEAPTFTLVWLALSVLLAHVTHWVIERPVAARPTRRVAAWCLAALAVPVAAAVALQMLDGLPGRALAQANAKAVAAKLGAGKEFTVPECLSVRDGPRDMLCARDASAPPDSAVWGDSKGEALYWGLVRESHGSGADRWMLIGSSGCPASDAETGSPTCAQGRPLVWSAVSDPRIRTVLLVSAFRTLRGERQRALFEEAVVGLTARGKKVVIVIDNPTVTDEHEQPSACARQLAAPFLDDLAQHRTCILHLSDHLANTATYRQWLKGVVSAHANVSLFDTTPLLCDARTNICPVARDGQLLYSYGDHISDAANGLLARAIREALGSSRAEGGGSGDNNALEASQPPVDRGGRQLHCRADDLQVPARNLGNREAGARDAAP